MRVINGKKYVKRSTLMSVLKRPRMTFVEWETIGIIPPTLKDERGWSWYGIEHLEAIKRYYEMRGRELPEEFTKIYEEMKK